MTTHFSLDLALFCFKDKYFEVFPGALSVVMFGFLLSKAS
jgi:hypothetical protein